GKGFNVQHNLVSQGFIRHYESLGYEVGSHGGWIHNYFSEHVDKDDPKDLEKYLLWNAQALEHVTGKRVMEYSAPQGNQPVWVTHWLEEHGFIAYYLTGNTGMGPTQGYRDGVREGQNIWSFPIVHLNEAAAFEEMGIAGYTDQEIEHWLEALTDFAVNHRTVRLIYFHPPGIMQYREVMDNWLMHTGRLREEGHFRWYTMTG